MLKPCEVCGVSFFVKPSELARKKYCSQPCRTGTEWTHGAGPIISCANCGVQFRVSAKRAAWAKCCSLECRLEYKRSTKIDSVCEWCKKEYFYYAGDRKTSRFCSEECKNLAKTKKTCAYCGSEYSIKESHAERSSYCSSECMALDYQVRMKGDGNPNYRNAGWKICVGCSDSFRSYDKNRIYCGRSCFLRNNVKEFAMRFAGSKAGRSANAGKREDLDGLYLRSSWEANYARYLNWLVSIGEIDRWEYEPDEFEFEGIRKGTRFYIPDFKVFSNDGSFEYHEVKGWMDPKSKTKLKRMSEYHPDIVVKLIDKDAYYALDRDVKRLVPNWGKD